MRCICKLLIIFIIIYIGIFPVLADETEWIDPQEKTLRLAESFTREDFLIEASDFYDNSALITVYDTGHRVITKNITRENDSMEIKGRLNITVIDLQERTGNISSSRGLNVVVDQWVRIRTRVPGVPAPKVAIFPYRKIINNKTIFNRIFVPNSEILINFSLKNEGKAVLKTPVFRISSDLPPFAGERLNYDLPEIEAGNESEVITVRFRAPVVTEGRKSFTIAAEVSGFDVFGKKYRVIDSTYIIVRPQVEKIIDLRKYVSEKVYIGDIAVVSVSIKNNGSRSIRNMILTESLPSTLEPLDASLLWNITLEPYELKTISYKIRPTRPGIYYLPPGSSIIEYGDEVEYNQKSAKLIVNGPYVILMKSANVDDPIKGKNTTITVEAKNIGDATAVVKLSDDVPFDYSLSEGSRENKTISNTLILRPGMSSSYSYVLNTTSRGSYVLPQANAVVLDQFLYQDERYTQKARSNDLVINVREPSAVQYQEPAITPEARQTVAGTETPPEATTPKPAPGFEGYVIIIIFIIMLMTKKGSLKR